MTTNLPVIWRGVTVPEKRVLDADEAQRLTDGFAARAGKVPVIRVRAVAERPIQLSANDGPYVPLPAFMPVAARALMVAGVLASGVFAVQAVARMHMPDAEQIAQRQNLDELRTALAKRAQEARRATAGKTVVSLALRR